MTRWDDYREFYQAGRHLREQLKNDTVGVPVHGTYLVVDGRVVKASVDTPNYAGPQVHLITTEEELEDE